MIDMEKYKNFLKRYKLLRLKTYVDKFKILWSKMRSNFRIEKIKDKINNLKVQNVKSRISNLKIQDLKDKIANFDIKNLKNKIDDFNIKDLKNRINIFLKSINKENFDKIIKKLKSNFSNNKKAYVIVSVLGVLVIGTLAYSISRNIEANKTLSEKYVITDNVAEEYYYKGEYDTAIIEYNKLKEKDAAEGLWDARIAEIYSVKGDFVNSNKYLTAAKQFENKNGKVLNYITFTEFMNKNYTTALQIGSEALKQFPEDKNLIKTMFTVYMANNMMDEAKKLVEGYPLDTKSAYDIAEHARMLMIIGQWQEGYAALREAFNKDRDEYKIYDVLAQIAVYNRDQLLENITSLSEKNPNDIVYKMWLAKIYSTDETTANEAINIIEKLKQSNVGKIEIKLIEASALQSLKQNDKADELILSVIDENKEDYRVLHTAGWYYLNKKDYETAEKYCRESIIKNKSYPDNYGFLMTEILKAQGRIGAGESYFRTAIFKEPYNYNIFLTIANYYWYTAKDTAKALEHFELAQIIKPDDPEIKYNMALIYISTQKYDEAIKLLNQSIKLSDSISKYHRTLGTIYLLNKKPEEAIKEIRYAYAADQTDIMTLNNAGCYYISHDVDLEKGEYNMRKALEGITENTDKYTADTIKENYKKAKELLDKYNNGNGGELKMPDFVLFY